MRVPLHGGHAHPESTGLAVGPESILVFAVGVVVFVLLFQAALDRFLE